ncbi:hypothetical protein [Ornithinimicrobium kibberense]|uniref:hypothetical protein n=1 Tax=Ornithinimicrobium kibberense TaxID=282060 RepID=UPI0036074905
MRGQLVDALLLDDRGVHVGEQHPTPHDLRLDHRVHAPVRPGRAQVAELVVPDAARERDLHRHPGGQPPGLPGVPRHRQPLRRGAGEAGAGGVGEERQHGHAPIVGRR